MEDHTAVRSKEMFYDLAEECGIKVCLSGKNGCQTKCTRVEASIHARGIPRRHPAVRVVFLRISQCFSCKAIIMLINTVSWISVVVVVCLFIRFLSVDQSSRSGSR